MPCRCEPSDFELKQINNKKRDEERRKAKILKYYKLQADLVTRLLCLVSDVLTADQVSALPEEYHQWKQKHDEFDRKERAKEKTKKEKAKKLS